jgi:hypothetical protein
MVTVYPKVLIRIERTWRSVSKQIPLILILMINVKQQGCMACSLCVY